MRLPRLLTCSALAFSFSFLASQVTAQTAPAARTLTLEQALDLAESASEQVAIARLAVDRARGGEARARSEWLPQLNAAASYDRTLASEFEGLFDPGGSDASCPPLQVHPGATLDARVAELERAYDCQPSGGFFGGGGEGEDIDLPFGRENVWRVDLAASQWLYTGGRLTAQSEQANAARTSAEVSLASARAQVALDVAQAFFDAALSDRQVTIAQASIEQAQRTYEQTRAQREVGRQSEFDLLRAQVALDTLQPDLVRRQAARTIAYLRLKQLLEIPLDTALDLSLDLGTGDLAPPPRFAAAVAEAEAGRIASTRPAIALAETDIRVRDAAVTIARSQRLPAASLRSSYGLVNYDGFPDVTDFRTNWTVGAQVSMPIFNGGRIRADEAIARAEAEQARRQLRLTQELAALDGESARQELIAARAAWEATAGTVRQAERAYEIAELRYREGISTQLELSDARLLLAQAQLNRAQAGRDLQVARVRVALLPDLPLGNGFTSFTAVPVSAAAPASRASGPVAAARTTSGAQPQ